MPKKNQAELFISLLNQALEDDRLMKTLHISARSRASTERFKRLCQADYDHAMNSIEPLDSVQLMSANLRDTRVR